MAHRHGTGIEDRSSNIPFTSSDQTREFLFYPLWLGHFFCEEGYRIDRDTYPAVLLAYVVRGRLHILFRNTEIIAVAGDVIFMDCHEKHCYFSENDTEFLFINFSGQNAHELCQLFMKQYGWIVKKKSNSRLYTQLRDTGTYYVIKAFKKNAGISPRRYRKTETGR